MWGVFPRKLVNNNISLSIKRSIEDLLHDCKKRTMQAIKIRYINQSNGYVIKLVHFPNLTETLTFTDLQLTTIQAYPQLKGKCLAYRWRDGDDFISFNSSLEWDYALSQLMKVDNKIIKLDVFVISSFDAGLDEWIFQNILPGKFIDVLRPNASTCKTVNLLRQSPNKINAMQVDFIQDVTYPPLTIVNPGTTFQKIWRVQIISSLSHSDITSSLILEHFSGDILGHEGSSMFVVPNTNFFDISISLTAPCVPRRYQTFFICALKLNENLEANQMPFLSNDSLLCLDIIVEEMGWGIMSSIVHHDGRFFVSPPPSRNVSANDGPSL